MTTASRTFSQSIVTLALLLAALLWTGAAQAQAFANGGSTNIAPELLIGDQRPDADGCATLWLHMRPDEGWHGYWKNPGDAGFPPRFEPRDGARLCSVDYPVPQTYLLNDLQNHIYEGDYALRLRVAPPREGLSALAVDAVWLACTDRVCVPEEGVLRPSPRAPSAAQESRWQRALPPMLDRAARWQAGEDTIRIAVPLPEGVALDDPHLFVAEQFGVKYSAEQRFDRGRDTVSFELDRRRDSVPENFEALLRLGPDGRGLAMRVERGDVPPLRDGGGGTAWPLLLLGALAGGLLLNLMPCVFPILSLKALSLARAGESEARARADGLAYLAGCVVAALALGATLLLLRAGGEQVGWAFQLQEPAVVVALFVLAMAITANFAGAFELPGLPIRRGGEPAGAFATGLLAAFVATPCTGPFMAAALGAALVLPPVQALALFAALGLGLALPFVALGFLPPLRRRLPRPGPWMKSFRRWMALPMGLTAMALLWLLWRIGGAGFALVALAAGLAFVAVLAAGGRMQRTGRSPFTALALGLPLVAAGSALLLDQAYAPVAERAEPGVLAARPFSAQALAQARASGRPVFVWMTADWCLTCKVNERVAIERDEVRAAFEEKGVIVLRGDWTRADPAITAYLEEQGAAGVPLYVWYPGGTAEGRVLPQLLAPDALIDEARKPR